MKLTRFASLVTLVLAGPAAVAQTSGTLTGTAATYNYSTAPWVITSGPGTYPDGGGVATFAPITGATPGTVGAASTVTFDVSPTLSQMVFNTPIQYILATGTGQSIVAANSGLTLNTQATAQNVAINGLPTSIAFGTQITGVISGGGTAGLTKTGPGNITLGGANTYTGGTHINGGFLTVNGAVTDSVFGATGAGNGLSFNGGSLFVNATGGLTTNRDVLLEASGGTVLGLTAASLGGVISGTGSLTQLAFGASGTLTLTGANTYTGATITRSGNQSTGGIPTVVTTTLSGAGSIASSSTYDLMGTFTLSNTTTNVTDRLSDTAAMTVRGVNFVSTGSATVTSSETVGAVTGVNGSSTFLVTPGTGQANSLTMASLARQNSSTFVFRGTGLGGTPGANVANIFTTVAPALTGGGGGTGSTNISILPYAVGNSTTATAFTAAGLVGSSFVTNGATGLRPLAATEYATAFGANATDNVRVTAVTTAPASTVNAILVAPSAASTAAAPVLTGGTVNVTSGAVMYSPTANVTGFISAAINFGAAEGVVCNTSLLTVSSVLSGSNGLTLNTVFAPTSAFTPSLNITGANNYTGNTTVSSGLIGFSGTVADGSSGAFGAGGTGSAIILNAGTNIAGLSATAVTTVNRDIRVVGSGPNFLSASASGYTVTFNGNVRLEGNLNIYAFTNAAASAFNFNGDISGPGSIRDVGDTFGVFNGNNSYSGGTTLNTSTFYAGSDTAFGTGPIALNGTGAIAGAGTATRTLANNLLLNATTVTFGGTAPLTLTGGVDLNGARIVSVTNTAATTFAGVVSNGALTKTGAGVLALNSPTGNTYTGGTVLAAGAGTLNVNNVSGSGTGTGAVSIGGTTAANRSTLSGNFTISGATSITGALSPGNAGVGTANFGSSLTLATNTSVSTEISGPTAFDRVNVGGPLTLGGSTWVVTTINGYQAVQGDSFALASFGSASGTVTFDLTNAVLADPANTFWNTSAFATTGTIFVVPVPEPSMLLGMSGLGLLGLDQLRRRRAVPTVTAI